MQAPHIRPARPADAEALATFAEQSFRETFGPDNDPKGLEAYVLEAFSLDRTRVEVADPASLFRLAEADGLLVGYAKLRLGTVGTGVSGPAPIELHRLYVGRAALGLGVGARLMEAALSAASEAGFGTVWLGVWERNARAIAFYERWGFRHVGAHTFRLGTDDQTDLVLERTVAAEGSAPSSADVP